LPYSYASEAKEEKKPEGDDDGPGTYTVTLTSNGRQARIEGDSKEDVINKVITRHPNLSRDDFTVEKSRED